MQHAIDATEIVELSRSRVARRKAKTKSQLLAAGLRIFSEKGIYWAKVEDVTEACDLGKGTFYKYFDSKDAIIQALLEEGLDELLARTRQAVRTTVSRSKKTVLMAVVGTRLDFFLENPEYLLLLHQVRGMMQLEAVGAAKPLRDIYEIHLQQLVELLTPVTVGTEQGDPARDLATAVAAYSSGLLTYHLLFEGPEATKRRRDYFLRMLLKSLDVSHKKSK